MAEQIHTLVVHRDTIEAGDTEEIAGFVSALGNQPDGGLASMGSIDITVYGYDDDDRELYTIVEVRRWFAQLIRAVPDIMFFVNLRGGTPLLIMLCVVAVEEVPGSGVRVAPDGPERFLKFAFHGINQRLVNVGLEGHEPLVRQLTDDLVAALTNRGPSAPRGRPKPEGALWDNSWPGPANFAPPPLPDWMWTRDSIWPMPATVFQEVGEEILLVIVDPTDDAAKLARLQPFELQTVVGALNTPHGTLGYAVFAVANPAGGQPYAAWEHFFDLADADRMAPYRALATQSHWHVLILGRGPTTLNVFQFENIYDLTAGIRTAESFAADNPLEDVGEAMVWARETYTLLDLFNMGSEPERSDDDPETLIRKLLGQLRAAIDAEDRDRVRAIGEMLHEGGGMSMMSYAHRAYTATYGDDGAPRLLDMWWSGIGEWCG